VIPAFALALLCVYIFVHRRVDVLKFGRASDATALASD